MKIFEPVSMGPPWQWSDGRWIPMHGRFVPSNIRNPEKDGQFWCVTDHHPDVCHPVRGCVCVSSS